MPTARDWRDPVVEDEDVALQGSDVAIGYLGRNPRYCSAYERALETVARGDTTMEAATEALIEEWGLSYVTSPTNPYDAGSVIARPDVAPTTVVLVEAPAELPEASPLDFDAISSVRQRMTFNRGTHAVLADPEGYHHVWHLTPLGRPVALLLPNGPHRGLRLAAATRLHRHLRGLASGPPPLALSAKARRHHQWLLRALDARLSGAKSRDAAAVLIGDHVREFNAAEWCDSSERRRLSRWNVAAVELMNGGYLRLLRGS